MYANPQRILTVSELTVFIRETIEQAFPEVWLEGEVSNLRVPSSGHVYFTLKDAASQIRTVMFRSQAQRLRFLLKEGLQVVIRGRVTVYELRGEYQIVAETVEPKGLGSLQLAFEQLKEKLAAEGLFDEARKRPLPFLPRCIGVVTSSSGAAIRDILSVLERRCPLTHVLLYPVAVQGDRAAGQIAEGIHMLSRSGRVDVLIVGRGGGSWEDLWSFNEEVVIRAIVASAVPVISGIGHEIDFTLSDFAADHRAATPSAAAEAAVPVLEDLAETLRHLSARHQQAMRMQLQWVRQDLNRHADSLPRFRLRIQQAIQCGDELGSRLRSSLHASLSTVRRRVMVERHHLSGYSPHARIRGACVLVSQLAKRTEQRILSLMVLRRHTVLALAGAMDSLSPLAVLRRGYSIVQRVPEGEIVRKAEDVVVGQEVRARLAQGQLLCTVREVIPES
jgi:exodeoxyribonuclease VII large subunit